jgi:hypothetical protein
MVERSRYLTDLSSITDLSHLEVSVGQSVCRRMHLFIVLSCAISDTIAFAMSYVPLSSSCQCFHQLDYVVTKPHMDTFVEVDIYMAHADLTQCSFLPHNLYYPGTAN